MSTVRLHNGQVFITLFIIFINITYIAYINNFKGDRLTARVGTFTFTDAKNAIKCVVKLGKKGSTYFSKEVADLINGRIYYYNNREQELDQKQLEKMDINQICEHDFQGQICDVSGSYLKNLLFGTFFRKTRRRCGTRQLTRQVPSATTG